MNFSLVAKSGLFYRPAGSSDVSERARLPVGRRRRLVLQLGLLQAADGRTGRKSRLLQLEVSRVMHASILGQLLHVYFLSLYSIAIAVLGEDYDVIHCCLAKLSGVV